ncbi:lysozyme inhibitor LprI family protein [Xanthomonas hyacinthi]|nr:lysozyme inhibitor LprI family protein [Xanthomonas hyacinthi]
MWINSSLEKVLVLLIAISSAACGRMDLHAQENMDERNDADTRGASSPGKLTSGLSSSSAQKQAQAAHENDQLLEKALDEPAQQKRADLASQVRLRSSYKDCVKNSAGVTPALLDCNAEEYRYQDARLNKLYNERMLDLAKSQQSGLREKQRKWIKSRDKLCNLGGSLGGGQAEALERSSCHLNVTVKRGDELEAGAL